MENPSMLDKGKSSLKQIKELLTEEDIGAIIIEGSSGSAGCILYPDGYLKELEKICKENNVLLICDEIMSGWGRIGYLFGYMKHDIKPDIITTSKGFTNGYIPLGATIISKEVASIYEKHLFIHGLTYFAHPLSCKIANKCLDLYLKNDQKIIRQTKEKGLLLNQLGKRIEKDKNLVKKYRNNGLLGCFELDTNNEMLLRIISKNLLRNGVFCSRRQNRIFTAPPLIITEEEIKNTMQIIQTVLHEHRF